jgi:hypothetical protein
MEWKILIHPSVAAEMEEAVLWYSLKSSGKSRCITLYVHVFAVKQSKFRHSPFQKQEVDLVVKSNPFYLQSLQRWPGAIGFIPHQELTSLCQP